MYKHAFVYDVEMSNYLNKSISLSIISSNVLIYIDNTIDYFVSCNKNYQD